MNDKLAGAVPIQRTVAWKGGKVPSSAAVSAFSAHKPVKKLARIEPYDPDSVVIEYGVPIPPALRNGGQRSRAARLLDRLKPGGMVALQRAHAMSLKSYAKKVGIKVTVRKDDDSPDVWRVWRFG